MLYMGKLFSLNAFTFKASIWLDSCFWLQIASIKQGGGVTNTKYRAANEGAIFPSVIESRERTISRVVEQSMPERKRKWAIGPYNLSIGRDHGVHVVLPYHFSMKRLRHGELRDLTCPRHRVVYRQPGQKHFLVPSLELCSSVCYCHPLLKINTNPAWNIEEFSICGEQEAWWILRWKSVWEKEGKWMILLGCDSLAKLVQDSLCPFTPSCLPTKNNKTFGYNLPGFLLMHSDLICLANSPACRLPPGMDRWHWCWSLWFTGA